MQKIINLAIASVIVLLTIIDLIWGILSFDVNIKLSCVIIILGLIFACLTLSPSSKESAGSIITYASSHEYFKQVAAKIDGSKRQVLDLTMGLLKTTIWKKADEKSFKAYQAAKIAACSREVSYQEVFTFPTIDRINLIEKNLKRILRPNRKFYKVKYFDITPAEHQKLPPFIQMFLIDERYLFLGSHCGTHENPNETYLFIEGHDDIIKYFQMHLTAVWGEAISIALNEKTLDRIKLEKGLVDYG